MTVVEKIVFECVRAIGEDMDLSDLVNADFDTGLYPASLDSMALVSLIADIEERLASHYGRAILLANEKSMSARNSPFQSVQTLVDYVASLLQD